jgi:hypothetical protein
MDHITNIRSRQNSGSVHSLFNSEIGDLTPKAEKTCKCGGKSKKCKSKSASVLLMARN